MSNVNKVILVGRFATEPEKRYFEDGTPVVNVRLATNMIWKDRSGKSFTETEYHRIVFRGRLADVVDEYLEKGSLVYVEGRLKSNEWTTKDGQKRTAVDIVASDVRFLSGIKSKGKAAKEDNESEDLPF